VKGSTDFITTESQNRLSVLSKTTKVVAQSN